VVKGWQPILVCPEDVSLYALAIHEFKPAGAAVKKVALIAS
jgi:hypothetical protein